MRTLTALLVLGIVVLSACTGQAPEKNVKELLSCKCEQGVAKVSESAKESTYKCDDALCPGMASFECWQRTCNFVSIGKATGDVERFDGKCCPEPGGDERPVSDWSPSTGACTSDSDCVPASCCHPSACTSKAGAPDCSGIMCTMECAPGTLDCGAGKCVCDGGNCRADIRG